MTKNAFTTSNPNEHESMRLADLLEPWALNLTDDISQLSLRHLTLDSRDVGAQSGFIAVPGHTVDGRHFIDKAILNGAKVVLSQCDPERHGTVSRKDGAVIIEICDLQDRVSELALRFYPVNNTQVIAVTGTNGKTTITQLIAQWLELIGHRAAVMGTTGNGFLDALTEAKNTTGSPIEIAQTLHSLELAGAEYTALETSSHGLVQHRVKAVPFKLGMFTNLSRDHLDYHHTMAEYEAAKRSLFTEHHCEHAVINVDDPVGARWVDELDNAYAVSVQPLPKNTRGLWATQIEFTEQGIQITIDGTWGEGQLTVPLIGEFNASNLLLALTGLLALGFDKQRLLSTSSNIKPVIGRMELFSAPNRPKVVVDYAHTPDALEKALQALRVHCSGKLWVVVGCGGDRDKGKRPMMAASAERLADRVIFSDDNPRSEDPATIVADMLEGTEHPQQILTIHDRGQALESALANASTNDIILLAGKGHEDYQIYADRTVEASDRYNAATQLGVSL
ncbi:UDP-N-acetylmuramoyl-L-alanyl-D-glutamate--2,6-diaminopimelate ligase [Vibrio ulleungensis]|uniref:UDP-N-acetylmuramoyl-L-alanyl-D-glutamate--2,6-diaminopimelate ligase n=1 Tax=Vibrio ulleungensis TaxID=2807619 RepID=A0ABS2HMX4_9VIBR|nr:UDP-N-acetylmuramoyl-L-alanyl-D-glutamate--2,6-diaminopimelate ligase [Vibrio ulleungensis]MBM7037487.1 UDP-N-acetylmuramoyl-L-alanyl-D-glutamate--2,6-diaminopimelate ligase [Vibrio ulleungensis]